MKLIIAIIQPHRLEAIKQALADVEVFRLTVMDVQGFGRQRGQTEAYRGHDVSVNFLRKVQLMIAVNEAFDVQLRKVAPETCDLRASSLHLSSKLHTDPPPTIKMEQRAWLGPPRSMATRRVREGP